MPLQNPAIKPEKLYNFTPVYSGVESLAVDQFADDDEMLCIKTSAHMLRFLLTAWELYRYDYVIQGSADDREHTYLELLRLHEQIMLAEPCPPDCPPESGGGGGGGGGVFLPECVTTEQQGDNFIINIEECCDMTVIINIKDCCCDESGGGNNITGQGAFGSSGGGGGGGGGSWTTEPQGIVPYSGSVSGCEVLTGGVVDYILKDQHDMLIGIGNSGGIIANVIDFFATYNPIAVITSDGVDWLTDQAVETMSNAAELWIINEFREQAKEAWVKTFGDRQSWKQITRQELLAWAANIKNIWYVGLYPVAARVTMQGLIRFQNLPRINQQLALASGECDHNDYEYYLAGAGVPYSQPTDQATLTPPLELIYDWTITYDFTIDDGGFGVSVGTVAVYDEFLGWRAGDTQAVNHAVALLLEGITWTNVGRVECHLSEGMGGTANIWRLDDDESPHTGDLYDGVHENETVMVAEFDPEITFTPTFSTWLNETPFSNNSADDFSPHVTKIVIFGTGTPPPEAD
jgi:hypothetical protein